MTLVLGDRMPYPQMSTSCTQAAEDELILMAFRVHGT